MARTIHRRQQGSNPTNLNVDQTARVPAPVPDNCDSQDTGAAVCPNPETVHPRRRRGPAIGQTLEENGAPIIVKKMAVNFCEVLTVTHRKLNHREESEMHMIDMESIAYLATKYLEASLAKCLRAVIINEGIPSNSFNDKCSGFNSSFKAVQKERRKAC